MSLEEYRDAWQRHEERGVGGLDEDDLVEWVAERSAAFESRIRRRDLLETVAAVLVAALFGWEVATASSVLVKVGAAIVVGAAALIAWRLRRARRSLETDGAGRPVADRLRVQRRKVDAQIELLESVLWWYVAPLALGAALFVYGLAGASWWTALALAVVVGVSLAVRRLNRRAVRRDLRPRREELTRRLRRLEEADRDGSGRPGLGPGAGGRG